MDGAGTFRNSREDQRLGVVRPADPLPDKSTPLGCSRDSIRRYVGVLADWPRDGFRAPLGLVLKGQREQSQRQILNFNAPPKRWWLFRLRLQGRPCKACRKTFPGRVRRTADPSASLGMTKERATFLWKVVSEPKATALSPGRPLPNA